MSRYRPPAPSRSPYITAAGRDKLLQELRYISQAFRHEVVKALSAAAAEGDRSENAEYIYRKKQLREIDSRTRYLVKRLEAVKCIDQKPADLTKVFFGAWIGLEDEDGNLVRYRIVGSDEIDSEKSWISVDSPLARALLKKSVDDEIVIDAPKGRLKYWLTEISYEG